MNDQLLERGLPANIDAEKMILGCSILDNSAFEQAAHVLDPAHFFKVSHRKVFAAMSRLFIARREIDPVALADELHRTGDLEQVGGPAYLSSLFDGVPRFSHIENYVRIVREKWQLRQLVATGSAVMNRALDGELEVDEQLAEAERALLGITAQGVTSQWKHIGAIANSYITEAEARATSDRPVVGFSTGFCDVDYYTLGLERKTVNVIAARPGVGKTGFALALTENLSDSKWNRTPDDQPPVIGWFSFEMPDDQLARRLIASRAGVDLRALHLGRLTKDEWRRVGLAEEWFAKWRVHVDDRCGLSIPKMREAIRQLKQDEGAIDVIVIDYLQLGDGDGGLRATRNDQMGAFSKGVTQIAKDYNLCVIALSQCNRNAEARGDRRISLGDLRESGQIEQDAYMVWGLYRDEVYNPKTDKPNIFEIDILKQRNGPLARVELYFDGAKMAFRDLQKAVA